MLAQLNINAVLNMDDLPANGLFAELILTIYFLAVLVSLRQCSPVLSRFVMTSIPTSDTMRCQTIYVILSRVKPMDAHD
jgi:hypothetical protein